ncbi:MAG TPA: hypothetical protein PKK85_07960 [Methanobacteriaceae archaeon]|nr:hypothetical protein [Methanobacteriaceae archaeon]
MADFKYLKNQEKRIEKKKTELNDKTESLLTEARMDKIKEKYEDLLKKKKSGLLTWSEEELLAIYQDAIKMEKEHK